jgi:LEA14-like dessication related protein
MMTMMLRYRSLMGVLLLATTAAACGGPRAPEIQFEGVRLGGVGLRGGTLYAQILVSNPNRFDIEATSVSYALEVPHPSQEGQWVNFTEGRIDERVRVAGRGSTILEVPITFQYDDASGAVRALIDRGSFPYRVSGDVRLAEPIARTIPYRRQGTVSLSGTRE